MPAIVKSIINPNVFTLGISGGRLPAIVIVTTPQTIIGMTRNLNVFTLRFQNVCTLSLLPTGNPDVFTLTFVVTIINPNIFQTTIIIPYYPSFLLCTYPVIKTYPKIASSFLPIAHISRIPVAGLPTPTPFSSPVTIINPDVFALVFPVTGNPDVFTLAYQNIFTLGVSVGRLPTRSPVVISPASVPLSINPNICTYGFLVSVLINASSPKPVSPASIVVT